MLLKSVCSVFLAGASTLGFVEAATSNSSTTSDGTLPYITIEGNAFFNSETGERFYIRGVDYQPGGSSNLTDPLADVDICSRDIPYFEDLGLNAIRVYTVDNSLDHTECMNLLADAGIYLILDLNTPGASISRYNPACSYNADYLQSVFATVDAFADFNNTLGFFAGNEVVNSENTTNTATYVKATVRDVKNYIDARGYRSIPVGYSAADVSSNRQLIAEYLNCGDDAAARIDMFGVNDYSWCGESSFRQSGYAEKMTLYEGYSIPIFLSEYGCNEVTDSRPFTEVSAIYSTSMSSVFSGGLVYEYSEESNNYGLVKISGNNVTELDDYDNLKAELEANSDPSGDGGYSTSNNYSSCPSYESGTWEANNTLPSMPDAASVYFTEGAGTPLGTGVVTQELCSDEEVNVESSNSDTTSSTATTTSTASFTSSNSSSSSTATSSSKSKNLAGSLEAPSLFFGIISALTMLL